MAKTGFEFVSPALSARLDEAETSDALVAVTKGDLNKSVVDGMQFDVAEDKDAQDAWDAGGLISRLVVAVSSEQYSAKLVGHVAVFVDKWNGSAWQQFASFTATMTGTSQPPYIDVPWDGRALTLKASVVSTVACDLGCVVTTMKGTG